MKRLFHSIDKDFRRPIMWLARCFAVFGVFWLIALLLWANEPCWESVAVLFGLYWVVAAALVGYCAFLIYGCSLQRRHLPGIACLAGVTWHCSGVGLACGDNGPLVRYRGSEDVRWNCETELRW
jgi:hypothetical protein